MGDNVIELFVVSMFFGGPDLCSVEMFCECWDSSDPILSLAPISHMDVVLGENVESLKRRMDKFMGDCAINRSRRIAMLGCL